MNKKRKIFITLIIVLVAILVLVAGILIFYTLARNNKSNNKKNTNIENSTEINQDIKENEQDIGEVADEIAIETFNSMFQLYEGTAESMTNVKSLLSTIETNNSTRQDGHIIVLDNTGITKKEELSENVLYDIRLYYDDDGYVSNILIKESNENTEYTENDMDKLLFNSKFTPYIGEINGKQLLMLLKIGQEINSSNPEHQLGLSSNNLKDLNSIKDENIYEVMFSYDRNGYINSINIDFVGVKVDEGEDYSEDLEYEDILSEIENI